MVPRPKSTFHLRHPRERTAMKKVKCNLRDLKMRRVVERLVRRHGLDRRKVYSIGYNGELATDEKFTGTCSGCSCDCGDGYPCGHGNSGCDECGHTGKSVTHFPAPVKVGKGYIQIRPYTCPGCDSALEHFDAGCPKCASETYIPLSSNRHDNQ